MEQKKPKIRVTLKKKDAEKIVISTEYIRLDSFLKLSGAVMTGGHAKEVIRDGEVLINGQRCEQRGKKLRTGDAVCFARQKFVVVRNEGEDHDSFETQHS